MTIRPFFVALVYMLCSNFSASAALASTKLEAKNSEDLEKMVYTDLAVLKGMRFSGSSAEFKRLFGEDASGVTLYSFAEKRIKGFRFHENSAAVQTWMAVTSEPGEVDVFPGYAKYPLIGRLGIILHEARHSDVQGSYEHIDCPAGNGVHFEGQFYRINSKKQTIACDSSSDGSYWVQGIFLATVARYCESCSESQRQESLDYFVEDSFLRFPSAVVRAELVRAAFDDDPQFLELLKKALSVKALKHPSK